MAVWGRRRRPRTTPSGRCALHWTLSPLSRRLATSSARLSFGYARASSPARPLSRSGGAGDGRRRSRQHGRACAVGSPTALYVGESTRRATEQTIVYEAAGSFELKGKERLKPLWRAQRVVSGLRELAQIGRSRSTIRRARSGAAPDQGSLPQLRRRAQGAPRVGHGDRRHRQVAPGLGVLQVFRRHRRNGVLARGRCLSYGEGVTYWALADMVRMRCRDRRGRGAGVRAGQAARHARGADPRSRRARLRRTAACTSARTAPANVLNAAAKRSSNQRRLLHTPGALARRRLPRPCYLRATELRESQRTELHEDGLNKPQRAQRTSSARYRTQEVAGSSPASSPYEVFREPPPERGRPITGPRADGGWLSALRKLNNSWFVRPIASMGRLPQAE